MRNVQHIKRGNFQNSATSCTQTVLAQSRRWRTCTGKRPAMSLFGAESLRSQTSAQALRPLRFLLHRIEMDVPFIPPTSFRDKLARTSSRAYIFPCLVLHSSAGLHFAVLVSRLVPSHCTFCLAMRVASAALTTIDHHKHYRVTPQQYARVSCHSYSWMGRMRL